MDLQLDGLEVIFSQRHKALLIVDEDYKDYNGKYYEAPNLIELQEKEGNIQLGIVQNIPVENLEELLKAYIALKEQNMIPEEKKLEGLELLKNKNKTEKHKIKKGQMSLLEIENTITEKEGEKYKIENDNDCSSEFLEGGDEG